MEEPSRGHKRELLADCMSALDMPACNKGHSPTFVRRRSKSNINITFPSASICGRVNNWEVLETESLNLHKYISFNLNGGTYSLSSRHKHGWVNTRIDKHLLSTALTMTLYHPKPSTQSMKKRNNCLTGHRTPPTSIYLSASRSITNARCTDGTSLPQSQTGFSEEETMIWLSGQPRRRGKVEGTQEIPCYNYKVGERQGIVGTHHDC